MTRFNELGVVGVGVAGRVGPPGRRADLERCRWDLRRCIHRRPACCKALSSGQGEQSKLAVSSACVGIIVSCVVGELSEDAVVLGARQLGCDHRYFLSPHRYPGVRVGQQVPRPRGVSGLSPVASDQEEAIAFSHVSQWYLPSLTRLSAGGGQQ
jgi:hypothetical protein